MSRYTLRDVGFTYKKIMHNRRWVGRVCGHAEGGYLGKIGSTTVRADTEARAFHEVVAKHCGFDTSHEMDARNRDVRSRRRKMFRQFNSLTPEGRIKMITDMLLKGEGS